MSYTLAEAAEACGINKSTVLRAVKSGRISGTRDEAGAWHVEAAELHRVFPVASAAAASIDAMPRHAPHDAATDALVALLREQLADLRRDRDCWKAAHDRVTEALTTVTLRLPPPVDPPKRRWWRRG